MAESSGYPYEEKIASRCYHVYKETTWTNAKVGDKVKVGLETNKQSIKSDPYACAILVKNQFYDTWGISLEK